MRYHENLLEKEVKMITVGVATCNTHCLPCLALCKACSNLSLILMTICDPVIGTERLNCAFVSHHS
jgi:hypothetical protein